MDKFLMCFTGGLGRAIAARRNPDIRAMHRLSCEAIDLLAIIEWFQ